MGSRQNRMPLKSRSFRKAKPSVKKTDSGRPGTASNSSTAKTTFRMSTPALIASWSAVAPMAAAATALRLRGSRTRVPAM